MRRRLASGDFEMKGGILAFVEKVGWNHRAERIKPP
jgi:hypothetical protein